MEIASDVRESASVVLGTISVLTWTVAEIPQIIANYKQKSTVGLSLAFLLTWIIGDLLNVVGCWLEPATLMTQFYTALFFLGTSFILTGQKIYYGYLYHNHDTDVGSPFCEGFKSHLDEKKGKQTQVEGLWGRKQSMQGNDINGLSVNNRTVQPSTAISYSSSVFPCCSPFTDGEFFYQSAKSLASSPKAVVMPCLSSSHDSGQASPSYQDHFMRQPLLGECVSNQSTSTTSTKNLLCVVSSSILLFGSLRIHFSHKDSLVSQGYVISVGRKLLQDKHVASSLVHDGSNSIGTFLGWAMAVVYMGGRVPQIFLNIKRGHAEGLSPLMFTFALLGNGAYIASILVRSLDWSQIRPNLPWLVVASGCVLLDISILIQFSYFLYKRQRDLDNVTVLK